MRTTRGTSCGRTPGPSDICLAPQMNGSGVETHYMKSAGRQFSMSQQQVEAWTNLHDYRCKDIKRSLNVEILEMLERSPETRVTPSKLKFLWRDKVVYF